MHSWISLLCLVAVLIITATTLFSSFGAAQNTVSLYYFYGADCPHCLAFTPELETLEAKYPDIRVHKLEISYNETNAELLNAFISAYNPPAVDIPAAFIGTTALKPFLGTLARLASIPGAVFLGIVATLAGLPCTGPLYLLMLDLFAGSPAQTGSYLLLYLIPLIIILMGIYLGTAPEEAEAWRKGARRYMKLIVGVVMLGIGAAMLIGII